MRERYIVKDILTGQFWSNSFNQLVDNVYDAYLFIHEDDARICILNQTPFGVYEIVKILIKENE